MKVNTHIKSYLVCLGIIVSSHAIGQDDDQMPASNHNGTDTYYKYSIQGGVGIPYPVTDNALVKSLVGIYMFHVAQQFSITKRLFAGVEFQDAEFAIGTNALYNSINPDLFMYHGGIDVGYHSSMARDFMSSVRLTIGEAIVNYTSAPIHVSAAEPTFMNLNLFEGYTVNEDLRIGIEASFTYVGYTFDPYAIGIGHAGFTFIPSDIKNPTIYLSWGLGLYWVFGKGK